MNLPQFTVGVAAIVAPTVTGNVVLPQLSVGMQIVGPNEATMTITVPQFVVNASLRVSPVMTAALTLPRFFMTNGASLPGLVVQMSMNNPNYADIDTDLPKITAVMTANSVGVAARLLLIQSDVQVSDNINAPIGAGLTVISSNVIGGGYFISGGLPHPTAVLEAISGPEADISDNLPVIHANLSALPGSISVIDAQLHGPFSSLSALPGSVSSISANIYPIRPSITAINGIAASISGGLTRINAALNAGFGAIGSITAKTPVIAAALDVLAQATAQQLVMVVGTHTNVVTHYDQYPFNSFFEINGAYYGVGPDGLFQIDSGDDDNGTPISAGISTGLINMDEEHIKRIESAYMTLRTAGELVMTITVDEGEHYEPVELTLSPEDFSVLSSAD
jgi:hypothetical protein